MSDNRRCETCHWYTGETGPDGYEYTICRNWLGGTNVRTPDGCSSHMTEAESRMYFEARTAQWKREIRGEEA